MPEIRDDLREGASRWTAVELEDDALRFLGRGFDSSSDLSGLNSGRCAVVRGRTCQSCRKLTLREANDQSHVRERGAPARSRAS